MQNDSNLGPTETHFLLSSLFSLDKPSRIPMVLRRHDKGNMKRYKETSCWLRILKYIPKDIRSAMPARFRIKVTKIGNSLRITIPQAIAEGFGISAGDIVIVETRDSEIVVKKPTKQRGLSAHK